MDWTRRDLLRGAGTGLALASAGAVLPSRPAGAEIAQRQAGETLLGQPVRNRAVNHVTFDTLPDGRQVAYQSLSGEPAWLAQVDTRRGEPIAAVELPGAQSVWAMTVAPDGACYVGGAPNGHVYRFRSGDDEAQDLGVAVDGETFLYGLATDADGRVYGGSYPNGVLWRYDPATDQFFDYGQIQADSIYSRSLAVARGKAYVGLGTVGAFLYEIDLETGAKREILLPEEYRNAPEISNVEVRLGRLFVRTSTSRLLVYDLASAQWVDDLGVSVGSTAGTSPLGPRGEVYYLDGANRVVRYQVRTQERTRTDHVIGWTSKGFGWVTLGGADHPGRTLVSGDYIARLWYYNPATGSAKRLEPDVPAQPVHVQSLALGPDGRVYASGYQSGGLAYYDPSDDTMRQFERGTVGQAEGMMAFGDRLYLGIYPGASILEFDPSQPFDYGTNPDILGPLGDGQDRTFAWTAINDKIVIGSVPTYGQRGGAVSLLDPVTSDVTVYRDVIPDHSVTALTTVGDLVLGGTSVFPGLGIPPADDDGRLFLWDPVAHEVVWDDVPIPGELAITDLVTAPNGHVFGVTVGKLFEFDPAARSVVRVEEITSWPWDPGYTVWVSGELGFGSDGMLYAQVFGTLYRIDPTTLARTQLATGHIARLEIAADTTIYFTRGPDLYRLDA